MNHLLLHLIYQSNYWILTLFLLLSFSPLAQAQSFTLTTNQADNTFEVNEQMFFEVASNVDDSVSYTIKYDRFAPIIKSGKIAIQKGQKALIPFTASFPSSVVCFVSNDNYQEQEGAMFAPFKIQPSETPPTDLEAFWQSNLADLANIPIDPALTFLEETEYSTTYRINLATIDNRRVYGYISIPKQSGTLPAILSLPPFGAGANIVQPANTLAEQVGAISMIISIHNAEPDERDENAYTPDMITNRDQYYQKYSILAVIRAIDYLHTRTDFNGDLALTGVSQGGGLTLMAAGLDKRVKAISFVNPTYSDFTGFNYGKASGFPYYVSRANEQFPSQAQIQQATEASKYYDATFLASNFTGPALAIVGYEDQVCPASTSLAVFNQLAGLKILHHGADLDHRNPSEYWIGRYDFFRRFLKGTDRTPWPYAQTTKGYFIDAGADHVVKMDTTLELSGVALYNDEALNQQVTWSKTSGTGQVNFFDETALVTKVSFTDTGEYVLNLSVRDDRLLGEEKFYTLIDQVKIKVEASEQNDHPPLQLNCPADIQVTSNTASTIVNWETPTVNNACEGTSAVVRQTKGLERGSNFPVGTSIIEYAVTDACGRSVFCSFQVEVIQTLNPLEAVCPNNISVSTTNESAEVMWELPIISNACSDNIQINLVAGLPSGSNFPIGITTITYEIADECDRLITCSFQVEVVQTQNPLNIRCPQNISISTFTESAKVTWEEPLVFNACSDSIQFTLIEGLPSGSYFLAGTTTVTYEVADECGGVATCSFEVNVIRQTLGFNVQCPQDTLIFLPPGQITTNISWEAPLVTTDCTYGLNVRQVTGPLSGNIFTVGTTNITYLIEDECGNKDTCIFTITVKFASTDNMNGGGNQFATLVYPNPANQVLFIELQQKPTDAVRYTLEITDKLGKVMIRLNDQVNAYQTINIADLVDGWYVWRIIEESKIVETGSFIKLSQRY